jgi:hypothetical protein
MFVASSKQCFKTKTKSKNAKRKYNNKKSDSPVPNTRYSLLNSPLHASTENRNDLSF